MRITFAGWIAVLLTVFQSHSIAAEEKYQIDPSNSKIAFTIRQFFVVTKGEFHGFSGIITLDRSHLENSSVEATIQVKSIDTANKKRDEHLRTSAMFDVEKYPLITFRSQRVKPTGLRTGKIEGELSMHGVAKPMLLKVQLINQSPDLREVARTRWKVTGHPIRRSDFGLLFSPTVEAVSGLSQEVKFQITIEAVRVKSE